jgi:cytochrome P450
MSTLPPGPSSQLWSMLSYLRDPLFCMVPLAEKYGDPFTFPGKPAMVCVGDPVGIKALYSADPDTFEPLLQDMAVFLGRHSLLLTSGAEHRRQRKLMMPPFHGARMRAYGEIMCRLVGEHSAGWTKGHEVKIYEVAQHISLDVILQAVFGLGSPEQRAAVGKLVLDLLNGISPLIALFPSLRRDFGGVGPFAAFSRRKRLLHDQLDALILAARAAGPRDDILSLLVHARDEEGQSMSDEEIRDQLLVLVVAGHETTAISLAWALYELHRPENAPVIARLRAELEALSPDAAIEKIDKLPYLEAVCQETLRRYPIAPAPSPRKLLKPFELMGHSLPAGVAVTAAIGVTHFREDLYPEPRRFNPDRFLERKFTPFEYLPYGGGARRCIGAAMASYELRLVLATLLRRFRLRPASLKPDHGKVRAANVGPATAVKMIVEERLS